MFSRMKSINKIDLSHNLLNGSITVDLLKNLTNLERLYISWNKFSGVIPTSLGYFTKLLGLLLDHNPISGTIPQELGKLALIQYLKLDSTHVYGRPPSSFCNLPLQALFLNSENCYLPCLKGSFIS